MQSDITRRLFLTASFLNVWQAHNLNVNAVSRPVRQHCQRGRRVLPHESDRRRSTLPRFSDFGAGWRFTRDLFAQYVYSTDYGASSATHTLMLRYTFHLRD